MPILGICIALSGCAGGTSGGADCSKPSTVIASLKVWPTDVVVNQGETYTLAPETSNACGNSITGASFAWGSEDTSIISVNDYGQVTGLKTGKTRINVHPRSGPEGRPLEGGEATLVARVNVAVQAQLQTHPPIKSIRVYPPGPVVMAKGSTLQMAAQALDATGRQIPGIAFSWTSDWVDVATVDPQGGVVRALQAGLVKITAFPTSSSGVPPTVTVVTVLDVNGAPSPPPILTVTPADMLLSIGDVGQFEATVTDATSGVQLPATVTWTATPVGVVSLNPLPSQGVLLEVTGLAAGTAQVTPTATVGGFRVVGAPLPVTVLSKSGLAVGAGWQTVAALPLDLAQHRMSAVGNTLFITGGIAGDPTLGAGPREDVLRTRVGTGVDHPAGTLWATTTTLNPAPVQGWDLSPYSRSDDPYLRLINYCTYDPVCLSIKREAVLDVTNTITLPSRWVHYQVFGHAQSVWSNPATGQNRIFAVGGLDAQVDLGIYGPGSSNAVGPQQQRYSDLVLWGDVKADGTLPVSNAWFEGLRLPAGTYTGTDFVDDKPGRAYAATVVHNNRLYVLGGWGWIWKNSAQRYVGLNRPELLMADIDLLTGALKTPWWLPSLLPEPLNRHAVAMVGDWMVVSGGRTGSDETVTDQVSNRVYVSKVSSTNGWPGPWNQARPLPRPVQSHAMLNIPGTSYLVMIGGDDLYTGASADVYLTQMNLVTGALGPWQLLPPVPADASGVPGITGMGSAVVVQTVNGRKIAHIYVAGGGILSGLGPVGYEISRHTAVFRLDIEIP
ncbi:MAG: Ig-like domain-containing protein [Nitrospirota bacterium]|nr:Ig-like domain-containing protein [Nitrospirota bacterium]